MNNRKLLTTGIAGTVITGICCFSPVLVILLGAIGLSVWVAWLDFVLWPLLFVFIGITAFALLRFTKRGEEAP